MTAKVLISIGSNCGDRSLSVGNALNWLKNVLTGFSSSPVYETPGVGKCNTSYMNCVVEGFFDGSYSDLDVLCKDYEKSVGRNEECRNRGLVPVDIDVVKFDHTIMKPWDFEQQFFKTGLSKLKQKMIIDN